MTEIDFNTIEKKWQEKWEKAKCFEVKENPKKKKYYIVEMYPYPSGSGLHIGHAFNYTIGDIYARFKRMFGFNVLYPMGYDSFGLPAENAAIKNKSHPKKYTEEAIANFIKQQKALGLSYDWSRMVETHKPSYYKWDQWIFLKMYEKGLVYKKKSPVNWCPKCGTVLANEQVHHGMCWIHKDTFVEIKHLEQWFLKITNYADELYDKVGSLTNWPSRIKAMQKNWIGKSYGTEIDFEIENKNLNCIIIHGCPSKKEDLIDIRKEDAKHWIPWIRKELMSREIKTETPLMSEPWKRDYNKWKVEFEKNNINENTILIGHSCGGGFLVRWLGETKRKIKKLILVAPWKIADKNDELKKKFYNFEIDSSIKDRVSEIVMFTSDNESDDGKKSLKLYYDVLGGKVIELKNKGHFNFDDLGGQEFPELMNEIIEKWPIFTTRPDTIYGVTFMVISSQHPRLMELVTPKQKKEVLDFLKKIKSTSEKDLSKKANSNTYVGESNSQLFRSSSPKPQQTAPFKVQYKTEGFGDIEELDKVGVFTGSYAINPINNEKVPVYTGNFVIADYGSGMVMAVPAHDERDFQFAKKYKIPIKIVIQPDSYEINAEKMSRAYTSEGRLVNSGEFNSWNNLEAIDAITEYLEKKKLGRKTLNYKLRDWLISRQRFWGTPIPIIYCDKCGIQPVPEKDLPVVLPDNIKFNSEKNPLIDYKPFVKTKCPKCNSKARRETDTMDTFVNSSWYFFRYCDSHNDKKIFDTKKAEYWMPMDQYIGGAEHACMHLIYCRFYTKFLRDLGLTKLDEPTLNLFNQGMVHGEDGYVMSKSRGNVVDPLDMIKKYSCDTLRMFMVSIASPESDYSWSNSGIESMHKFVKKVIEFFNSVKLGNSSPKLESKINKTIKEVTFDIENFKYNLAVIKIRGIFDVFLDEKEISKFDLEKFIKLISLFCPHIAEELWEKLGNKNFISLEKWPIADEKKIDEKFEKQEQAFDKTISDILNVLKIIKEKQGKDSEKVYIYVLPNELELYDSGNLSKKLQKQVKVFAVNDKNKYDPEGKANKTKPGKPGIFVE